MIHGTGLDIIEISRIKKSMEKFSGKFEGKIFTPDEIKYCASQADPSKHFAGRFAVKEAVLKSMGIGLDHGVSWKDMEVLNHESGKPFLRMQGKGKDIFDSLKLKAIHISISHDNAYAIAQAVAEK